MKNVQSDERITVDVWETVRALRACSREPEDVNECIELGCPMTKYGGHCIGIMCRSAAIALKACAEALDKEGQA